MKMMAEAGVVKRMTVEKLVVAHTWIATLIMT